MDAIEGVLAAPIGAARPPRAPSAPTPPARLPRRRLVLGAALAAVAVGLWARSRAIVDRAATSAAVAVDPAPAADLPDGPVATGSSPAPTARAEASAPSKATSPARQVPSPRPARTGSWSRDPSELELK
jgi:hypothetical protein